MRPIARSAVRYAAVGVLNSAMGFMTMAAVLYIAPTQTVMANATGFAVGFVLSFALNRTWTFSDRRPLRLTLRTYLALVSASYAVNLMVVLTAKQWPALGIYLPQFFGMCTYTALVFLGSHFIVFKDAPVLGSK